MPPLEILYLAFGYRFLMMAINSARSARKAGTQCYIKLITNLPLKRIEAFGDSVADCIKQLSARGLDPRKFEFQVLTPPY